MTYETEKAKLSRQPLIIANIELDNTLTAGGAEYHCDGQTPHGQLFHQSITKTDFSPAKLEIASGLGYRGQVKISFQDFNIGSKGTYFGKLFAANPYYLDRKIKVYYGFYDGVTFDWNNFKERLYFIKKIIGPDSAGKVSIIAKDPLSMLDEEQATIPNSSDGALVGSLSAGSTGTINITDNTGFDSGGGVARIEDELVRYSGLSGGDSIVITARGVLGSEDKLHDASSVVTNTYAFEDVNAVDAIRNIIENFTPIDHASFIPDSDWNTQRDNHLSGELVTGVISEPTPVKSVIERICEYAYISMWWEDEDQEIKLLAIGPTLTSVATLNENEHILESNQSYERDSSKLITRVIIYFEPINYSKESDDKENFQQTYIDLSPAAESAAGVNKAIVKRIYARYLPDSGLASASKIGSRLLKQYKQGLNTYKFKLDVKDSGIKAGDLIVIDTSLIQDVNGDNEQTSFLVTERKQVSETVFSYKAVATGFTVGARYAKVGPDTLSDYSLETTSNRENYGFISDNSGLMSDSETGYLIS